MSLVGSNPTGSANTVCWGSSVIERRFVEPDVVGLIPTPSTRISRHEAEESRHSPAKRDEVGSSPTMASILFFIFRHPKIGWRDEDDQDRS